MSLFEKPAPPTAKPKYKVMIAVNVPAYAEVEIEAESQADAERKVAKELDEYEDEFASRFWQNSVFTPNWQQAEDFRIVDKYGEGQWVRLNLWTGTTRPTSQPQTT